MDKPILLHAIKQVNRYGYLCIPVLILALQLLILPGVSAQVTSHDRETGEILVMLRQNSDPFKDATLKHRLEETGIAVDKKLTRTFNIWLFTFDESTLSPEVILSRLRNHPAVEIAQLNHKVTEREIIPNDPSFNVLWALKNTGQSGGLPGADIRATEAWSVTTSGTTALGDTIVIAMVDGGVDLNHPDLNLFKNYADIPGNNIDDDNNGYTDDYNGWNAYSNSGNMIPYDHGTHVAGIAAARTNNNIGVSGVSFNAQLLPIAGSSSNEAVVVRAYDYVYTMRKLYNETNGELGAFIVASNSSFGINNGNPANYPLWSAMYDSMGMVGVLNVASTANAGWDVDIEGDIPTAMTNESIISITNTTNLDERYAQAAWGYTSIDLGAPGTQIYSTLNNNKYGYKTGTSMSSPMVSGSVALLYAATDSTEMAFYKMFPSLAMSRFKRYLIATVDTIPTMVGMTVSGGRLNLLNAVNMAANPPTVTAFPQAIQLTLKPDTLITVPLLLTSSATEPDAYTLLTPPDSLWISIDTITGVMMPNVPKLVNVTINTEGMAEGDYSVMLSVNDYFLTQRNIPVDIKVDFEDARNENPFKTYVTLSPNPFTDLLKIHLSLAGPSVVKARVFNMQGQEVAQLLNGNLVAGIHSLTWDGRTNNNQTAASGVYFIEVTDRFGTTTLKAIKN